jgi:hypothetical protein
LTIFPVLLFISTITFFLKSILNATLQFGSNFEALYAGKMLNIKPITTIFIDIQEEVLIIRTGPQGEVLAKTSIFNKLFFRFRN